MEDTRLNMQATAYMQGFTYSSPGEDVAYNKVSSKKF